MAPSPILEGDLISIIVLYSLCFCLLFWFVEFRLGILHRHNTQKVSAQGKILLGSMQRKIRWIIRGLFVILYITSISLISFFL